MKESPVFKDYPLWSGIMPKGYVSWDFLGIKTKASYFSMIDKSECNSDRYIQTSYPKIDEEYFEWITLLKSIKESSNEFVMMELGAGWGRWSVRAVKLCESIGKVPYVFSVEADKQHFKWLIEHMTDNAVSFRNIAPIEGIISDVDGNGLLTLENPEKSYGQAQVGIISSLFRSVKTQKVQKISLSRQIHEIGNIDLIDMDIQGMEYNVLSSAIGELNKKVKCLYIETHSRKNEDGIRKLLSGWQKLYDFPSKQISKTEYGDIYFQGGVQVYKNINLV